MNTRPSKGNGTCSCHFYGVSASFCHLLANDARFSDPRFFLPPFDASVTEVCTCETHQGSTLIIVVLVLQRPGVMRCRCWRTRHRLHPAQQQRQDLREKQPLVGTGARAYAIIGIGREWRKSVLASFANRVGSPRSHTNLYMDSTLDQRPKCSGD
jgi:hypothetical protein